MPEPSSKHFFGSIVVSISACHSKEQLAGGRGSIPRQRDTIFFATSVVGVVMVMALIGEMAPATPDAGFFGQAHKLLV
jgi:hypothetical protein